MCNSSDIENDEETPLGYRVKELSDKMIYAAVMIPGNLCGGAHCGDNDYVEDSTMCTICLSLVEDGD